ncbi:MAG TPA: hybrid sensor histidine kinase/response regulator [Elusimicrobiota bacterium]|nr:hybrid sensor histidine kinase/response regulator [Elusimicrobiota bacterium]
MTMPATSTRPAAPVDTMPEPVSPRVLFFSPVRSVSDAVGGMLQAAGCQVAFCDSESLLPDCLAAGPWDIFFGDAPPAFFPAFFDKVASVFPAARGWLLLPDGVEAKSAEKTFERSERRFRLFERPVTLNALLRALEEDTGVGREGAVPDEARVLIVDADPVFCETLLDFLATEGYRGRTARSGREAIDEFRRQFYHIILLDSRRDDMSVEELARRLHEVNPHAMVIEMADFASLDRVLHAMRADVHDYLLKPLDPLALRRTLHNALEKQKLGLEIQSLLGRLSRANRDLVRVNELKNQFLRIVSHDLRTPLTAVKGYAQALKAGMIPPAKYERCFGTMSRECENLEHLIGDLVDFVSIEAGKMRLEKAPTDVHSLFEGIVERFRDIMEGKKIRYRVEGFERTYPPVSADPRRMDQVLSNLVGNAAKHTPEGKSVTVQFRRAGDFLEVRVVDTGEGISPEHAGRVFDQFYQAGPAMVQKEGLGLGLAIAKEIVGRHGGKIGVHSDGLGEGTTFWFTLPFMPAAKGKSAGGTL